ncbi:MAG: YlxM family DNA-binding protein [Faecalibacillus sp.]
MENSLEKKQRINLLMDIYEELLTDKQRQYLDLYYNQDLSLSEIALIKNVSKNAVFDNLKKATAHLEQYEEKLRLLDKHKERLEIIDKLENDIKEEHKNIDEHLKMLREL